MALQIYRSEAPVLYEGCVIDKYERNGYDDSDFFATVWDEELQKVNSVLFDTTRGASTGWAEVDCSDEMLAEYKRLAEESPNEVKKARDAYSNKRKEIRVEYSLEVDKRIIEMGDSVEVPRIARGKNKGKEGVGTVTWMRQDGFARDESFCLGVELNGEKIFINEKRVKKIVDGESLSNFFIGKNIKTSVQYPSTKDWDYEITEEKVIVHRGLFNPTTISRLGLETPPYYLPVEKR